MLEALRRRSARSGPDVILVDVWEGDAARAEAARYRDMWGIEGTVLLDEDASYIRSLGVRGIPTNIVVDAGGVVRAVGASTPAQLADALRPLAPQAAELLATGSLLGAHGEGPVGLPE